VEGDAHDMILQEIFQTPSILKQVLQDQSVGVPFITKVLSAGCASIEERQSLVKSVRAELEGLRPESGSSYKKLWDEINQQSPKLKQDKLETAKELVTSHTEFFPKTFGSPARAMVPQSAEEPLPPLYPHKDYSSHLPTPNHSPQYYNTYYQNPYYSPAYGYNPQYFPAYAPHLNGQYYPEGLGQDDNQYQ
jgi:hypothetical protein